MVNGHSPKTLQEALAIRAEKPVVPYAGGTELMVFEDRPGEYLFVHALPELKAITEKNGTVCFGAAATYTEILQHPATPELLRTAVAQVAAPAIRNAGTIGGNICNASPAGDTLPVLYLCNAVIIVASLAADGTVTERRQPIGEFITGVRKTTLAQNELMVAVEMEKPAFGNAVFEKVGARKAQAISKLSFAAAASLEDGKLTDFRAAFGAVGITVVRLPEAEKQLVAAGRPDAALARQLYEPHISPIDDQRSTAEYRKQVCLNLLADFIGGLG